MRSAHSVDGDVPTDLRHRAERCDETETAPRNRPDSQARRETWDGNEKRCAPRRATRRPHAAAVPTMVRLLGGHRRPSRAEQAGQAPQPCDASTRWATRICAARLAVAGEPLPPFARQVPAENCRPPE
jgi:hypothetical protein